MAFIRRVHPRAYQNWTAEEEAELKALTARGRTIRELAAALQRQPGAIRSRLHRLGFPAPSQQRMGRLSGGAQSAFMWGSKRLTSCAVRARDATRQELFVVWICVRDPPP